MYLDIYDTISDIWLSLPMYICTYLSTTYVPYRIVYLCLPTLICFFFSKRYRTYLYIYILRGDNTYWYCQYWFLIIMYFCNSNSNVFNLIQITHLVACNHDDADKVNKPDIIVSELCMTSQLGIFHMKSTKKFKKLII